MRSQENELIAYLRELVRIPSDNPPGDCDRIAQRVEAEFRRFGINTERYDVRRRLGPAAPTILGWLGPPTTRPQLLLNAHVDVIPPGEGWSQDPYGASIVDGRVVGRGAAVSKSDVASYTYALAAVLETYGVPEKSVVAAITSDEETGGEFGPKWLIHSHGIKPKFAICAGFSHGVVIAHNGCLRGTFLVRGQSAHAAMPWIGIDAVEAAQTALARIYEIHRKLASRRSSIDGIQCPTLVATSIRGGGAPGSTAGVVEIQIDRRILPTDRTADALAELHELAARLTTETGADVTFKPTLIVEPLKPNHDQQELIEVIQEVGNSIVGHELRAHGVPIFTDARWFAANGTPTVLYGAGPANAADARGHGPDENVSIGDLVRATKVIARVIHRLITKPGGS